MMPLIDPALPLETLFLSYLRICFQVTLFFFTYTLLHSPSKTRKKTMEIYFILRKMNEKNSYLTLSNSSTTMQFFFTTLVFFNERFFVDTKRHTSTISTRFAPAMHMIRTSFYDARQSIRFEEPNVRTLNIINNYFCT
jgi:hypothetical protein